MGDLKDMNMAEVMGHTVYRNNSNLFHFETRT